MDPLLGDPAAMRQVVATLGSLADRMAAVAASADGRVQSMDFQGPAAIGLRARMTERRARTERLAMELQDLSQTILQAATRAEQAQAEAGPQANSSSAD